MKWDESRNSRGSNDLEFDRFVEILDFVSWFLPNLNLQSNSFHNPESIKRDQEAFKRLIVTIPEIKSLLIQTAGRNDAKIQKKKLILHIAFYRKIKSL